MSKKWYGQHLLTTDVSATPSKRIFLRWRPGDNFLLHAYRTWLIIYNDVAFTDVKCHLYSDVVETKTPGIKLASSTNLFTKAQVHTLANAAKGVYFKWNDIALRGTDFYHFILEFTAYASTDDSAGAYWRNGWPDPVYQIIDSNGSPVAVTSGNLATAGYSAALIGALHGE